METTHWTLIISFTSVAFAFASGLVMFAVWATRAGQFKASTDNL